MEGIDGAGVDHKEQDCQKHGEYDPEEDDVGYQSSSTSDYENNIRRGDVSSARTLSDYVSSKNANRKQEPYLFPGHPVFG